MTDFTYTEAMERAGDLVKTVSNKVDAKLSLTLLQVLEQYRSIKAVEKDEKSATTNHKRLLNILPDDLLNVPAVSITGEQFIEWRNSRVYVPAYHEESEEPEILDKIRASKSSVNRDIAPIKAALRGVFGDTSQYGWSSLTKFTNVDKGRVLFLTSDEVERWMLHSEGAFRNFSRAAMLTGMRVGELRALDVWQFEELKTNGGGYVMDVLVSKTGPRAQQLSSDAAAFFKTLCAGRAKDEPLLLNDSGSRWGKGAQKTPMADVRKNANLPDDAVFYSLRHYYISRSLIAGFNILALSRNVGTSIKMIEQYYGKFLESDIQNMLNTVEV